MNLWERLEALLDSRRQSQAQAIFFRSLATLMTSGVHIVRALQVLARQTEYRPLALALERTVQGVSSGYPLSRSLPPQQFSRLQLQLIAVGEKTGRLHHIFQRLADEAERGQRLRAQVKGALTYPLMVLAAAFVLAILAQNFIFKDFLANLKTLGAPLPWSTQVLMLTSTLATDVRAWVLGLAAGAGLLTAAFKGSWWERVRPLLFQMPGVGKALRTLVTVQFLRALALCQHSGLPLLKGLQLACELDPVLAERGRLMEEGLKEGKPLFRVFEQADFFPPLVGGMLRAGEDSGKLAEMLDRAAQICEESLSEAVAAATALIQPLMLLGAGLVVGFVVLATMLPMLRLAQAL